MAQTQIFRGVQTTVCRTDRTIDGVYRSTRVCHAERIGEYVRIELNTAGWKTNTTKLRMNQFAHQFCNSQYGVYQKAGEWFVAINGNCRPIRFDGRLVSFLIDAKHVQFKSN